MNAAEILVHFVITANPSLAWLFHRDKAYFLRYSRAYSLNFETTDAPSSEMHYIIIKRILLTLSNSHKLKH